MDESRLMSNPRYDQGMTTDPSNPPQQPDEEPEPEQPTDVPGAIPEPSPEDGGPAVPPS